MIIIIVKIKWFIYLATKGSIIFLHQVSKGAVQGLQLIFVEHGSLVNHQDTGSSNQLGKSTLASDVQCGLWCRVKGCLEPGVVGSPQVQELGGNT